MTSDMPSDNIMKIYENKLDDVFYIQCERCNLGLIRDDCDVVEDLTGSSFRMLAGAMAFNYDLVFDDRIPFEDKIFNTLLGAFMTKSVRPVEFRNNGGKLETLVPKSPYVGERYRKTVEYLGELNMEPTDFIFNALAKSKKLETEYIMSAGESADVGKVTKILQK